MPPRAASADEESEFPRQASGRGAKSGQMPSTGTIPTTLPPKCRGKTAVPTGKTPNPC